jgi:pimeloyl-ACP methyl ester carboxylesterase
VTAPATARDETPLFFEAGSETLFGLLTNPTAPANGVGMLLLSGGLWTASPGRNRVYTKLGRQLAADGFTTLRFDYRGTGDSSGLMERFKLDDPLVDDSLSGAQVLRDAGMRHMISAGVCFGARTALAAAEAMPELRGIALFAPPVRDFEAGHQFTSKPLAWWIRKGARWKTLRNLFSRRRRQVYAKLLRRKVRGAPRSEAPVDRAARQHVSPSVVRELTGAIDRGVHVLMVFGEEDECYADFNRIRTRRLGSLLDRAGDLVSVVVVPGKVHGLTSSAVQRDVVAATLQWLPSVLCDLPAASG